jgi:hypothetical protein
MDSIPKRSTEASAKLESIVYEENSVAESNKEHLAPIPGPKVVDTETASQAAAETPNPRANKENLKLEEDTEASSSRLAIVSSTPKPLAKEPAKLDPVIVTEISDPFEDIGASTSSFGHTRFVP